MLCWLVHSALAAAFAPQPSAAQSRRRPVHACMKVKAPARKAPTKGFGKATTKAAKRAPVVRLDPDVQAAIEALALSPQQSIEAYLNPQHLEPDALRETGERLRAGEVVVLQDAFRPEFAEMAHAELKDKHVQWEHNEAYFPDGYHHRHQNVYDRSSWSERLNATAAVFTDPATARFMEGLTGRDCSGETTGAPSWCGPQVTSYK